MASLYIFIGSNLSPFSSCFSFTLYIFWIAKLCLSRSWVTFRSKLKTWLFQVFIDIMYIFLDGRKENILTGNNWIKLWGMIFGNGECSSPWWIFVRFRCFFCWWLEIEKTWLRLRVEIFIWFAWYLVAFCPFNRQQHFLIYS